MNIHLSFLSFENEGELELKLLYSLHGKGLEAAEALIEAMENFDADEAMPLRISVANDISKKILDRICENYSVEKYVYSARYIGEKI